MDIKKGKGITLQAWRVLQGSRSLRLREFLDIQQIKVVRLSVVSTDLLYPSEDIRDTHFCLCRNRHKGQRAGITRIYVHLC